MKYDFIFSPMHEFTCITQWETQSRTSYQLICYGLQQEWRKWVLYFFGRWKFLAETKMCALCIFEKIRPWARGLRLMRLKTIGRGWGDHPWWAHPYSSWLSSIKASKAIAGQWRVIASGMRAWHRGTRSTRSTTRPARKFPMTRSPKNIFYILHPLG